VKDQMAPQDESSSESCLHREINERVQEKVEGQEKVDIADLAANSEEAGTWYYVVDCATCKAIIPFKHAPEDEPILRSAVSPTRRRSADSTTAPRGTRLGQSGSPLGHHHDHHHHRHDDHRRNHNHDHRAEGLRRGAQTDHSTGRQVRRGGRGALAFAIIALTTIMIHGRRRMTPSARRRAGRPPISLGQVVSNEADRLAGTSPCTRHRLSRSRKISFVHRKRITTIGAGRMTQQTGDVLEAENARSRPPVSARGGWASEVAKTEKRAGRLRARPARHPNRQSAAGPGRTVTMLTVRCSAGT
jgi:hypothetical protein